MQFIAFFDDHDNAIYTILNIENNFNHENIQSHKKNDNNIFIFCYLRKIKMKVLQITITEL